MGFDSGSISFMRFKVTGQVDKGQQDLLREIEKHMLMQTDAGLPADVEWGWAGPNHVLDNQIDFMNCAFNDCLYFSLKIVSNKVPPELKRAWLSEIESAIAKDNPSGFISKLQKRQAKDELNRKVDDELRTGKYRRQKIIPLLWDLNDGVLYGPTSLSVREKLVELFNRTFPGNDLIPLTSGNVAVMYCEGNGSRRGYEDFQPTRFAMSPEDPSAPAEYPWVVRGDGAKDYLGNEFLMWLWFITNSAAGSFETKSGHTFIMFDRSLKLDCIYNQTGKESITGAVPTSLPESIVAIRNGKVPRNAGMMIQHKDDQFTFSICGESLAIAGLKLPDVDDADTARALFEEHITLLRNFSKAIDSLFEAFLSRRLNEWESVLAQITEWMSKHGKAAA